MGRKGTSEKIMKTWKNVQNLNIKAWIHENKIKMLKIITFDGGY
jgi:hypothetical protein